MNKIDVNKKNIDKISLITRLFGLSFFFILFSIESTFSMQSIILLVFLVFTQLVISRQKIILNTSIKLFFILVILYTISSFINILRHQLGLTALIQLLYQIVIFVWFVMITGVSYSGNEIKFSVNSFIYISVICSVIFLFNNVIFNMNVFSIKSLFGYQLDKNFFSGFICMGAILSFRNVLYDKAKIKNIVFFALIILCILFCNSRSSLIATILGVFFSMIIYLKDKITIRKLILVSVLFICGIFIAKSMLDLIPSWMYQRYFVSSYKDYSNNERISMWQNAFDGFSEQPILGYGPGNLTSISKYSKTSFGSDMSTATMSHNTYIDALVNGGFIGFGIFIIFLFDIFKDIFKYDKSLLPLMLALIFTTFIIGAGKSVFFWNTLILMKIESSFYKNKERLI